MKRLLPDRWTIGVMVVGFFAPQFIHSTACLIAFLIVVCVGSAYLEDALDKAHEENIS